MNRTTNLKRRICYEEAYPVVSLGNNGTSIADTLGVSEEDPNDDFSGNADGKSDRPLDPVSSERF
jgi:hypothetical protein